MGLQTVMVAGGNTFFLAFIFGLLTSVEFLLGSSRDFVEQACHVMEGCQGNLSSSCRLRL